MKWSAAANRGKVGKGIGAQIKSGEIGTVGASEKISGSGLGLRGTQHFEGVEPTFGVSTALKSAVYCFKERVVGSSGFKCQLEEVHYIFQWKRTFD